MCNFPGIHHSCLLRVLSRYNNGTALLKAGHYARAFQYLQKATVFLPSWPQLWLQLADCCIRLHVQVGPFISMCATSPFSLEHAFVDQQRQKPQPLVRATAGFNGHHSVILSTDSSEVANTGKVSLSWPCRVAYNLYFFFFFWRCCFPLLWRSLIESTLLQGTNPMMSLGYAELCLRNAYALASRARPEQVFDYTYTQPTACVFRTAPRLMCWLSKITLQTLD